jgi:EAL domain-containing protein (putative c-di-GMP-specific phosphodiesterase class I)
MNYNRLTTSINYLGFLKAKRNIFFQEFKKSEEFKGLMQPEKVKTVFQPILSLSKGDTVGFEILNRPKEHLRFRRLKNFMIM